MAEDNNINQVPENKTDKNLKPKFNSNWIFAILGVTIIVFQIMYGGKTIPKATTNEIRDMIINRDI
jgi:hypothetical protein